MGVTIRSTLDTKRRRHEDTDGWYCRVTQKFQSSVEGALRKGLVDVGDMSY